MIGTPAASSARDSFSGQLLPYSPQGTYKLNRDCTDTERYHDSFSNTIDYVFMVVDHGNHLYLQGNYLGGTSRNWRCMPNKSMEGASRKDV